MGFFPKFLATHKKLLRVTLELEITLPLRLSEVPFFLKFWLFTIMQSINNMLIIKMFKNDQNL